MVSMALLHHHHHPFGLGMAPMKIPSISARRRQRCTETRGSIEEAAPSVISHITASQSQIPPTWQVAVGSLAGITPFVVAAIEFSKRIVAQKKCEVCAGSGLVRRDKYYFRCYKCGGFLPWQSWKRFFSGK